MRGREKWKWRKRRRTRKERREGGTPPTLVPTLAMILSPPPMRGMWGMRQAV
jgi:hypothetical protein